MTSFAFSVFRIRYRVPDDVLLQHSAKILEDKSENPLHPSTKGQPPKSRLCDALDIISQILPMALGMVRLDQRRDCKHVHTSDDQL